ncbi:sensor histidine kinase [Kitasatospora cystarginea]|uniref:histidine kinase n=1 Tax=Kitasatospora cystarginea TaxID=58350 RepID=A0ABN3EDJ3_9ACTN
MTTVSTTGLAALWLAARRRAALALTTNGRLEEQLGNAVRQVAALKEQGELHDAELQHFTSVRLPAYLAFLAHPHVPVPGPLHPASQGKPGDEPYQLVLRHMSQAIVAERQRLNSAGQAVLRGAAQRVQAMGYQLQDLLANAQERFPDEKFAEVLLSADALNEQLLRRVQITAVACGAPPGLRRDDSLLADLVAGARSRVQGYERIRVTNHLQRHLGVAARAAESVAIILGELMANAEYYSPASPTVPIDVSLHETGSGAVIVVEDAGVGMTMDDFTFAEQMISGARPVLLTELGDPPRTGLVAVGLLGRPLGITVTLTRSRYNGTATTVVVPGDLLVLMDPVAQPASVMAPIPVAATVAEPGHTEAGEVRPGLGLPRRQGRRAAMPEPVHGPAGVRRRDPEVVRGTYSGLQRGTAAGRTTLTHASDPAERPIP